MSMIAPLSPTQLYRHCEPASIPFDNTDQADIKFSMLGQERVLDAVQLAVEMRQPGYNLFVMGEPGSGRNALVSRLLKEHAGSKPEPDDWCYVNNFSTPTKPVALRLPHGKGSQLRSDMQHLVEELLTTIPAMFEGDEYRSRMDHIDAELNELQKKAFINLAQEASKQQIALLRTPQGFSFAPEKDGEVMSNEEYENLADEEKRKIEKKISRLQEKLEEVLQQVLEWRKERRNRLNDLNREVTIFAVGTLVDDIINHYRLFPDVVSYLESVKQDVIENAHIFRAPKGNALDIQGEELPPLRRYQVNVIVENTAKNGAPVITEDHPTFQNLFGRVEHIARLGALVTDFDLIRAGALHHANGGYLLIDVLKLLMQAFSWEGLKRALISKEIRVESLMQMYGLASTVSLEPQPIPLDVKVILFGERIYYYLLQAYDPEFAKLFKIVADFEDDMPRDEASQAGFARMLAALAHEHQMLPFNRHAIGRIIEFSARDAADAERLSLHMQRLIDLMHEAEHKAKSRQAKTVAANDVQQAIDAKIRRADRIQRRIREEILRGTLMIDTQGTRIGQVNGLSVFDVGDFPFGMPTRITATTRLGDGEVIDIQREVALGGAIHSKGVLILSSFLASRYSQRQPLSLSASLVFEQTYGQIDGDSASLAELCALLSSLADVPIKQSLAITGSVNQYGQVQAIGGVNEKIEGFFDICKMRGLTGEQGVLIPATNVKHLMLRADVVAAAQNGEFSIYPVETVDDALTLLTGIKAGLADAMGNFPANSVNQRVRTKLSELLQIRLELATSGLKKMRKRSKKLV